MVSTEYSVFWMTAPLNAELEDVVQTITKSINTWNNVQCDHPIFDAIEMVTGQLPVVEKEKSPRAPI